MFDTFITQPVFNMLVAIYALLPGHDFGISILLFSLLSRVAMWPLIRKQLHHSKAMKKLQPELAKIRKQSGDDKQKLAQMQLELYKEKEINPLAPIGFLLVQMPIFLGLYFAVRKLVQDDPSTLFSTYTYGPVSDLSWVQKLQDSNFELFDKSLIGIVDLARSAIGDNGLYWPLVIIAFSTGLIQFYQTRQLLPKNKSKKKLREILADGQKNGEPNQEDLQAAVGKSTSFILPAFITFLSLTFPGAIALYWFSNTAIGFIQQKFVLNSSAEEMDAIKVTTRKTNTKSSSKKSSSSTKKVKSTAKTIKNNKKPSANKKKKAK